MMSIRDFLTTVKEILNEWRLMSTCWQSDLSGVGTIRGKERLAKEEMIRIT